MIEILTLIIISSVNLIITTVGHIKNSKCAVNSKCLSCNSETEFKEEQK